MKCGFALFLMSAALLRAADSTGTIAGTVVDAGTQAPVARAQASLDGTSLDAFTDDAGRFVLTGAPAGARKLTVTYRYPTMEAAYVSVTVIADGTVEVRVPLVRNSITFEEIAQRLALKREQRVQCASVLQELNAKLVALHYATSFTPAERTVAQRAALTAAREEVQSFLTATQLREWENLLSSLARDSRRILFTRNDHP
jgi:hypothetical protein